MDFFNLSRSFYRIFLARFYWGKKFKSWVCRLTGILNENNLNEFNKEYILLKHPSELNAGYNDTAVHKKPDPDKELLDTFIKIQDCIVFGGSRFIVRDKFASIGVSQPTLDVFSKYDEYHFQEEIHNRVFYYPSTRLLKVKNSEPKMELSGQWTSVLCANSENWMHWLTEHLPRFAKIADAGKDLQFGILHDEMHENSLNALKVISQGRPMIAIPSDSPVKLSCLLVPKEQTFDHSAFWPRKNFNLNGTYSFDKDAIMVLREKLLNHFNIDPTGGRYTFVRRNSSFRKLLNKDEIERALIERGFDVIEPGSLSLFCQVLEFSRTSLLVCQAGAALANILFMPKGARVVCIAPDSNFANYKYFNDYADLLGINFTYAKGQIKDIFKYKSSAFGSINHPVNAEFYCPLETIIHACQTI